MDEANVHAESLEPRIFLRHGALVAGAVSAAAYDAAQQTLVFALQDGQLLVVGGEGEQAYLASACEVASRFLVFLAPSQYLLRVSVQSEIELWSLRDLSLAASSLWPGGDITAVLAIPSTSFVFFGTEDGSVQPVCLRGNIVSVRASLLECGAPVVALAAQPDAADSGRVLVACTSGLVVLLDVESKLHVVEVQTGSELTCAAWVDSGTFVTAHGDGALRCWTLPRDIADPWRAPPARPASAEMIGELVLEAAVTQVLVTHSGALVVCLATSTACLVTVVQEGSRALGIAPLSLPDGFAGWVHAGWKARFLLALAAPSTDGDEAMRLMVHDGKPERLAWEAVPIGWPVSTATCAQMLCDVGSLLETLYESDDPDGDAGALAAQVLRPAARAAPALGAARLLVSGHSDGSVRLSSISGAALAVVSTLAVGSDPVTRVHADQAFGAACTLREVSVFALNAAPHRCGGAALDADALCVAVSETAGVVVVGCAGGGLATWCLPSVSSCRLLRPLPSEDVVALLFVPGESGPLLLALGSGCGVAAVQPATGAVVSATKPTPPAVAVALFALDQACAPVLSCAAPARASSSDDSGDELGDTPVVAETLVVCSQTALRVRPIVPSSRHNAPDREHCFTCPVLHAQMFVAPGGACVACLDESLALHVIEAAALVSICSISLFGIADERVLGESAAIFAAGLDGHVFAVFADSRGQCMPEAARLELLEEFSAPESPPEPPVLWDRSRATEPEAAADDDTPCDAQIAPDVAPAKRNILAGGLGGLRDTVRARAAQALKHAGVPGFKQRRRLTDDDYDALLPPPAAPAPAPFVRTRLEVADGGRAELLGSQAPALRSVDDIRRKYGRPARPAAETTATTAGVMGENLQKLNERGEKLANIQEKTSRMEAQAADFAASAKKLREQQEARTLFGLFS